MKHLRFLLLSVLLCVSSRVMAGELLYVNDANGQLGTVDVDTGVATVIGSTGAMLTDIAFDPSGQLFGISATQLYLVDPTTGAATAIGAHGVPGANAMVFGTDGTLYAAGSTGTNLYRLNPATGKSIVLFDLGVPSGGDLAFYEDDLYLTTLTNDLILIEPAFDFFYTVGTLDGSTPYQLATGANGTLFYGVAGTVISSVDPFSVRASALFDYSGQGLGAAAGTAFVSETLPAITSTLTATGQVNQPFTYQVSATNDADTFSASGLPAGLGIRATGVIFGTPTTDGTYNVTLTAENDGGGTGTSTLTLTVIPAARPVITSATAGNAQVGAFFYYKITAANTPTSFGAGALPAGLTFYPTLGVISGIPKQTGTATVAFSATNSAGSDARTLVISTAAPAPPVISLATNIGRVTAGTGETGQFIVVRAGVDTSADLRINYVVTGSAVAGGDYVALKGVKHMKPGQTSVRINVTPLGFGAGTGVKRIVMLTLAPGIGYTVGTAVTSKVRIFGQ